MAEQSKTLVAIGAHTGDAQLTSGLLLAKHAQAGDTVVTLDLTAGEQGAPQGMTKDAFRQMNVEGAAAFAATLGGKSLVLDIPDGELTADAATALRVADILRGLKADVVLCHWKNSIHKDHIAAHKIATDAVFYAAMPNAESALEPSVTRRTLYAENWEDADGFEPYVYVDVTEAFPLWREAVVKLWLTEHAKDFQHLRYYDALSMLRGALIRRERAVAFGVEAFAKQQILERL